MKASKDPAKTYHQTGWIGRPGAGGGPLGRAGSNTVRQTGDSKLAEVRRGKIYSFDAATYKALVFVDSSPTVIELPVAKNLASGLLAANTKVAVLCFDPSDPEDAVVLGPYGAVPGAWITSGLIVDGAIATADLADDAVTAAKIADDAVGPEHIQAGAVWGASGKKLLNFVPYSSSYDILRINSASDSSFSALINGLPSGTSVAYDTVVGNEDSIVPVATTQIGKLVLRNTTRGTSAKISTVNTSANTITVTSADDISGWADNDVITVNSATCVAASTPYYFDLDLSGFLPATAAAVVLQWSFKDSGTAGSYVAILHPYEAYADMKTKAIRTQLASAWMQSGADAVIPVISQKVCVNWDASGSATASVYLRISGWFEEAAV